MRGKLLENLKGNKTEESTTKKIGLIKPKNGTTELSYSIECPEKLFIKLIRNSEIPPPRL
jgi:hypothetical protein